VEVQKEYSKQRHGTDSLNSEFELYDGSTLTQTVNR